MEKSLSIENVIFSYRLRKKNVYITFSINLLLVGILGFLDYISGYEMSFSLFYLIPITISVVLSGFKVGVIISIISALSWYFADNMAGNDYGSLIVPVWNTVMRLGYFLLHTFLLSKFLDLFIRVNNDSLIDSLTGIHNRRYFYGMIEHELVRFRRSDRAFTLIYFDLDNFKTVNDTMGHYSGDTLLKEISGLVKSNIRPYDVFARMGGDEFALLLPETDYKKSSYLIKRLKDTVDSGVNGRWPVTLSIGAVTFSTAECSVDEMIKRADKLMYAVKGGGKNGILHELYTTEAEDVKS